jgi:hypothetical protein
MKLWLEKTERPGFWSGRYYVLRAQLVCSDAEAEIIARHDIYGDDVWLSQAALDFFNAAERAFDKASGCPMLTFDGWMDRWSFNSEGNGWMSAADGEAQASVGDLMNGALLEARTVSELMDAERGIRAGFEVLVKRIAELENYELGDEILIEPEDPRADRGVAPASWVRMGGGS